MQGCAEPKLWLARAEAAVQEKSSLLSTNQPEVQEPGRLPGQHGQQTGQRTAGEGFFFYFKKKTVFII